MIFWELYRARDMLFLSQILAWAENPDIAHRCLNACPLLFFCLPIVADMLAHYCFSARPTTCKHMVHTEQGLLRQLQSHRPKVSWAARRAASSLHNIYMYISCIFLYPIRALILLVVSYTTCTLHATSWKLCHWLELRKRGY